MYCKCPKLQHARMLAVDIFKTVKLVFSCCSEIIVQLLSNDPEQTARRVVTSGSALYLSETFGIALVVLKAICWYKGGKLQMGF